MFHVLWILRNAEPNSKPVEVKLLPSPSSVWAGKAARVHSVAWVKARSEGCTCLRYLRLLLRFTLTIEPGLCFQEDRFSNPKKQSEVTEVQRGLRSGQGKLHSEPESRWGSYVKLKLNLSWSYGFYVPPVTCWGTQTSPLPCLALTVEHTRALVQSPILPC